MSGGSGGEIRLRGGKWEARWYDPDGNRRSKRFGAGAPGRKMAREFASQQQLDARRAREGRGTYLAPAKKVPTFREVALAWLETSPGTAPKTRLGYAGIVHTTLLPEFGSTRIDKIGPTDLKRFAAKQMKPIIDTASGKVKKAGKSPSTVKSYFRVLGPIFEMAIDDEAIVRNPTKRVRIKAAPSSRSAIISASQVKLLASLVTPHYAPLVLTAAYTGMRAGELAALRWRAIDLDALSMLVDTSRSEISSSEKRRSQIDIGTNYGLVYKSTKSNRARTVRFPSFLVPLLGEPGAPDDLVFRTPSGTPLRGDNFRTNHWLPAVKKAHAADPTFPPKLRLHDLRHSCASVLIKSGLNAKAVQSFLGHSSISVTFDLYGHLFEDWHDDIPNVLDEVHRSAPVLTVIAGGSPSSRRKTA